MKIAIDGRFYGLENAGLGRYTMEIVKNISKIDKRNKYYLLLSKKYYKELKLPENWEKVLVKSKHYSFSEQLEIPRILKKIKPDFTHYLHFNVPLLSPRPYIVTIHDMIMHSSKGLSSTTLPWYFYAFKRIAYKINFYHSVKFSKKIITPSLTVKEEISRCYKVDKNKIVCIYLGIDKDFFNYKETTKDDYLLYVGNAYPHKNLVRLIEAIKKVGKKLVVVTSRNFFYKRLKEEIIKQGAEDKVQLLGHVNDDKLRRLYQGASAFVYPSLIEGFGFQGLEAMASRTLVLASNIDIFKEIYKDNALYFDPKNVNSITNTIEKLSNISSIDKNKILTKSQKYAEKFNWEVTAQETLDLYGKILQE